MAGRVTVAVPSSYQSRLNLSIGFPYRPKKYCKPPLGTQPSTLIMEKTRGNVMARLIIAASKGTDDPTMATLAYIAAKVATDDGHQVVLWLQGEAVVLARKGMVDGVQGVGLKPLKELAIALESAGVPLWVCQACAVARQISPADLVANAAMKTMGDYLRETLESDKNLSF
jgi:predicted peroxiredoxin